MTTLLPRLNFIGCGKAGRALGRLWHQAEIFELGDICTRSIESAQIAVNMMGAGKAIANIGEMQPADIYLIAVPDTQIMDSARKLTSAAILSKENIVFHLSGALESRLLKQAGVDAVTASVHPLQSFADLETTANNFAGTWCGFEGQQEAYKPLTHAFEAIAGRIFQIGPDKKLAYHAASVMVSNYVNALVESSQQCFELADIDRELSGELLKPILLNACKSILDHGATAALTGPIARGDSEIVAKELTRLNQLNPLLGAVYQTMGLATLEIAKAQNDLTKEILDTLEKALNGRI